MTEYPNAPGFMANTYYNDALIGRQIDAVEVLLRSPLPRHLREQLKAYYADLRPVILDNERL